MAAVARKVEPTSSFQGPTPEEVAELFGRRFPELEQVETHISWIYLTKHWAFKRKRPVRYDFLDFSTLEQRRQACCDELRLNRRLAREAYVSVLPLTRGANGVLQLGGGGPPVDWVVQMRRLPQDRTLEALCRRGEAEPAAIDRLAERLREFHAGSPPVEFSAESYRRALAGHISANRDVLLPGGGVLPQAAIRRAISAQWRLLRLAPELFDARVCDGRVVEGHGDLRPEHVFLLPSPAVIDCLEFNTELRRVDVLDELSFLAMECDRLDAGWVGERIVQQYRRAAADDAPAALYEFYKCYRATVRAKVHLLQGQQLQGAAARDKFAAAESYVQLADGYADRFAPQTLIVVRGRIGTGKSTLARWLAEQLDLPHLQTDAVRRELFGEQQRGGAHGRGIYTDERRMAVYDLLLERVDALLSERLSVIVDGTFPRAELVGRVQQLVERRGARFAIVCCTCSPDTARRRVAQRLAQEHDLSAATPEIYDRESERFEDELPGRRPIKFDTEDELWAPSKLDPELRRVLLTGADK